LCGCRHPFLCHVDLPSNDVPSPTAWFPTDGGVVMREEMKRGREVRGARSQD
jgi:hypothetical protein